MHMPITSTPVPIYRNIPDGYPLAVTLAQNIRRLRLANDIRQEDLAATLGRGQGVVSKWEKGKTQPPVEILPALACALNTSLDALFYKVSDDYDRVITRADAAHAKEMTPSVIPSGVEQTHPGSTTKGGTSHAAEATTAKRSADRRRQEDVNAEVRDAILSRRQDAINEFVAELYASADSVRAVADALRTGTHPSGPGSTGSVRGGGHPPVPPRPRRRKGGA